MKVLMTGGSGLLAKYLKIEADRPTHQELNIAEDIIKPQECDLIIHCAAYTDVVKAESDKFKCFRTNVFGTLNLLEAYPQTPFVYISSEYAHKPVNFYSTTKSLAEQLVMNHPQHLIIRTLFKPRPWPYDKAFQDQWTLGDYVDVIAEKIEKEISEWDRQSKMIYVGTGRKTMYELAKETKPDVVPNSIKEMPVKIPSDYK